MDPRVQRDRMRHSTALADSDFPTQPLHLAGSAVSCLGWYVLLAILLLAAVIPAHSVSAAVTPEQREQLVELRKSLSAASRYFRGRKFDESAEMVARTLELVTSLEESDESGDLARTLTTMKSSAEALAERLKANGVNLPGPSGSPSEGPSFANDVAPVLVRRCGSCHISRARGDFSMPTFEALMASDVVVPGDSDASHMIELIRGGDMPKGGGGVPEDELAKLTGWIDSGAKFDGDDPTTPLASLGDSGQPAMVELQMAEGDEKVKFSSDLAPVIVENCFPCHAGTQPSARLSLDTFRGLLRGGNNGPIVAPDDVAMSLLLRKLRGMEGQQMPLRKPPLSPEVIAQFETWIDEGAKFDGRDANQPLERMVRIDLAKGMSHEALCKQRTELAGGNWRLAKPAEQPEQVDTEDLLLIGNIDVQRMERIAEVAQQQMDAIAELMRRPSSEPLIKGRATLFLFKRRYDYSELGRMVEKRELSPDWTGHWNYDVIDAYACLLLPRDDEAPLDTTLAELLGGLYVESRGIVPAWFSEGSARAIAARVDPKSEEVLGWIQELKDLQATVDKPEGLLDSSLPEAESKLLRFGFVQFLMSDLNRYTGLLEAVSQGTDFDAALEEAYGRDASGLVDVWVSRGGRRR